MPPNVSQICETLSKKNIEKAPISSHKTEFLIVKIQNSFNFFHYSLIAMFYVLCKLVIQDIS